MSVLYADMSNVKLSLIVLFAQEPVGVAEQWDELGQAREAGEAGVAGGEFWKLLNHPANMQRQPV